MSAKTRLRLGGALALTALAALYVIARTFSAGWGGGRALASVASSGHAAAALYWLSLLASPLGRIARVEPERIARARRSLGLSAALAALGHGAVAFAGPFVAEPALLIYEPHLRAGAGAAILLGALAGTSFPALVAVPHWKVLHRATWIAAPLILLHLGLSAWTADLIMYGSLVAVAAAVGIRMVIAGFWKPR